MLIIYPLYYIATLGVLPIYAAHARGRFESIAITLTPVQTEIVLSIPEVIKTEVSLVTIVQVSTTTVKEVVRVTETLSGICSAAISLSEDPSSNPARGGSEPAIATTTISVIGSVAAGSLNSNHTQTGDGDLSKAPPKTDLQPSASGPTPCQCQCFCPLSSFSVLGRTTTSSVSAVSTFQLSFVTPGQSVSLLGPPQPAPAVPTATAADAIGSTPSLGNIAPLPTSTPELVTSGNIPFDIRTFSLLDEVTVTVNI